MEPSRRGVDGGGEEEESWFCLMTRVVVCVFDFVVVSHRALSGSSNRGEFKELKAMLDVVARCTVKTPR